MSQHDYFFAQFPEHNDAITQWFADQGWPVTLRHFDFDRSVFAWRHEDVGAPITLRVTLSTIEDWSASLLRAFLDEDRVAATLRSTSDKYILVRKSSTGSISLAVLDEAP